MIQRQPIINDSTNWCIYALVDPFTSQVRYIGFTTNVDCRLSRHINDAESGVASHKCHWIRSVLSKGSEPLLRVLEEGSGSSWKDSEKYWIKFYREEVGALLTNLTDGGEGAIGLKHSEESKLRMSRSASTRTRKPHSQETRLKIAESKIGKTGRTFSLSEEAKTKIRESKLKVEPELRRDLMKELRRRRKTPTAQDVVTGRFVSRAD